jgi:molybdate transport system substrate-binding protein
VFSLVYVSAFETDSVADRKMWQRWLRLVYKQRSRTETFVAVGLEGSLKPMKYLLSTIFIVALVFGNGVSAKAQSEITLLAPGPTRRTLDKILPAFEAKTGHKVKVTYATGRTSTQAVAKGEPLDVSLIVAPVTGALTSGSVIPSSETLVASYYTAIAVAKGAPKPDISTPAAVKKALLAAKSVGYEDADFTTAGQGPTEAIDKLGIADQIAAKSRLCAGNTKYSANSSCFDPATGGVRSIEKLLESGDVDIAMLFLSDMLPSKDKISIVGPLPRKICTPTAIVGFISTHASDAAAAKALLQYLASPEAQAIFKEAGFEPHS